MKNIITYSRVSTEEQKKLGFSLSCQKERLFNYARNQKYHILMHYEEDYSAKTFNRPQWKKLRNYCEKYNQKIDQIIFTKWDRFSRNAVEAQLEIEWFKEKGIEIYSVDNPLDFNLPESKITLAVYLTLSELENDKISIRVKEGLRKATEEGCWMGPPPYGYMNYRTPTNKATLIPDENAEHVIDSFILIANSDISVRQAWLTMREKGMYVSSSAFYRLIKNTVYIGKITLKLESDNKDIYDEIEGLHAPIVTTALFKKVQKKLHKLSEKPFTKKGINNLLYPLRGYIKCSRCSKILTASGSTGSNPDRKYHYYHCESQCGERIPLKKAHDLFIQYLKNISIDGRKFQVIKENIKLKVQKKERLLVEKKETLNQKIEKLKNIIIKAEDKFFQDLIDSETFVNAKRRYLTKINKYQDKILKLEHFNRTFEFQSRLEKVKIFIDLPRKYNDANPDERKKLLDSILKKKIALLPSGST